MQKGFIMLFQYPPVIAGYCIFIAILLGLVMGSFLNCLAIRICRGEKISRGRSHCMSCGHTLGVLDLIPLFSWLFLHGKCRYCGKPISARYPLSELVSALAFAGVVMWYGISFETLEMLLFTSLLLVISFCDIEDMCIPDRFIIAGIVLRAVFVFFTDNPGKTALTSIISGFAVAVPILIIVLIMEKILKKEAMGGGDIKLFFMIGLYLTWQTDIIMVVAACFCGILFAVLGSKRDTAFPFGPSIALAAYLTCLFGQRILSAYLSLF